VAERLDVRFPSAGVECSAWLYLPEGGPAPVIVMAHGLGGVRGMRLDAYAERFCAAGYACLVLTTGTSATATGNRASFSTSAANSTTGRPRSPMPGP
jgi:dienelactone hydrolase